jgi:hypothetical protein
MFVGLDGDDFDAADLWKAHFLRRTARRVRTSGPSRCAFDPG